MRAALLTLLLLAQDPARVPLAVQVDRLSDERVAVREEASQALVRLGESALPALRTAWEAADDPEVRLRLADVVARIEADVRRRAFTGGPEADGLKARLTITATEIKAGTPIQLAIEIMNVAERPCDFALPHHVDLDLPGWISTGSGRNLRVQVKRTDGGGPGRGLHMIG